MLNIVHHGTQDGRPLIIAHGLFGSARNWNAIAKRLSDERPVQVVDMRNHGSSPWADSQTYADMADDLAEIITENGGIADVLGHSMGGKAAMVLALNNPDLVSHLVVGDIAPVAYHHTQAPLIDAMRSVDLSRVSTRRDADAQLAARVPDAPVRAFLLQSLDLTGPRPRWRLNLGVLDRYMDQIIGFPQMDDQFTGPTLFLRGAASDYIREQHKPLIKSIFPASKVETIDGAGHWLHADAPRPFEASIRAFLT